MNNNQNRNSKYDVLYHLQAKLKHAYYQLNDMSACIDIGKNRNDQQDGILIIRHPLNHQFKMLAIADGMGGLSNGALASNIALCQLIYWFEQLPINYFKSESNIYTQVENKIKEINALIKKYCNGGGTTLSIAIISSCNTFLLNIGDSRIYLSNKNKLEQVSIDHSIVWNLYMQKKIMSKDDMRYHRLNHLITSSLGGSNKKLLINELIVSNQDYERIFLFTDGVTDCLSDDQLQTIVSNNNSESVANQIVEYALQSNSKNCELSVKDYYNSILGGKDNTSAAVLVKKGAFYGKKI